MGCFTFARQQGLLNGGQAGTRHGGQAAQVEAFPQEVREAEAKDDAMGLSQRIQELEKELRYQREKDDQRIQELESQLASAENSWYLSAKKDSAKNDKRVKHLEAQLASHQETLHEFAKQLKRLLAERDLDIEERRKTEAGLWSSLEKESHKRQKAESRFAGVMAMRVQKMEKSIFDVRRYVAKISGVDTLSAYVNEMPFRYPDAQEFSLELQGREAGYRRGPLFGGLASSGEAVAMTAEDVAPRPLGEQAVVGPGSPPEGLAGHGGQEIAEMEPRFHDLLQGFSSIGAPSQGTRTRSNSL